MAEIKIFNSRVERGNFMFSDRADCITQEGLNKSRAVIVEDNQLVQLVHKSMLVELGYEVDIVFSGEEALSKIENDYDPC